MFGPSKGLHHRSPGFSLLLSRLWRLYEKVFDTPNASDYTYLFLTGSGTSAIESVLRSFYSFRTETVLKAPFCVSVHPPLCFADRILNMARELGYSTPCVVPPWPDRHGLFFSVQYETGHSKLNEPVSLTRAPNSCTPFFVDAVSSFPYYTIPKDADIFVTVTGKQLGVGPGLAVVGIRNEWADKFWENKEDQPSSYLSLGKAIRTAHRLQQTPHTPAIGLLQELEVRLQEFNLEWFRKDIDKRREYLLGICKQKGIEIVGIGPVLTFKEGALPSRVVHQWELYNRTTTPQVFLWSATEAEILQFGKALRSL